MGRFIFSLPDEQMQALRDMSLITSTPIASLVRQGIDLLLSGQVSCVVMQSGTVMSGFLVVQTVR